MTKSAHFSFLKGFILLFSIISILIFFLQWRECPFVYPNIWIIQVFFLILTILAHFISNMGLKNKKDFHIFYLLSMTVRLMCCMIFVLIILFFTSDNHVKFVAGFFALYLVYTSFEIYFLLRNLQAD